MMPRRVRLALPLILLPLGLAGCGGGGRPAASTGTAASPSATPAQARTYTKQMLTRALLPQAQMPGFKPAFDEDASGGRANLDVSDLAPIKGIPRKCRATGGGPGLVDTSGITPQVKKTPEAHVEYEHKSTIFVEDLTGLPAGTPPNIGAFRIPAGCERQDGTVDGMPAQAKVRQLGATELPALGNAEITGLQIDFYDKSSDALMQSFRLLQVRSGLLVMQVVGVTSNGDITTATNTPATKAWTRARQQLG